ncbi:MAG: class I SAM-dependent methyltransferase [Acidimicrobiales bacterium]
MTAPPGRVAIVGAGTTPLVAELARAGFQVTAIDISATAITALKQQLPDPAAVELLVADVRSLRVEHPFDTWHDRAVFHFLTDTDDQRAYIERATAAIRVGGHLVIATFAEQGPNQCSGLPVARHSAHSLSVAFGRHFEVVDSFERDHITPRATPQRFTHAVLRRTPR